MVARKIGRPLKVEGESTTERILNAAMDMFSKQGFASTSVRALAEAVGVTDAALYTHFKGKKEILIELLKKRCPLTMSPIIDNLKNVSNSKQLEDELIKLTDVICNIWLDPTTRKIELILMKESGIFNDTPTKNKTLLGPPSELIKPLTENLQILMNKGILEKIDPKLAVLEFMGPLVVLRIEYTIFADGNNKSEEMKNLAKQHVVHFVRALTKNKKQENE